LNPSQLSAEPVCSVRVMGRTAFADIIEVLPKVVSSRLLNCGRLATNPRADGADFSLFRFRFASATGGHARCRADLMHQEWRCSHTVFLRELRLAVPDCR